MTKVAALISTLRQQDVKLWLDGDKLRYRAAKNTLSADLLAQLKIQKTEIISFLRSIDVVASKPMPPLLSVDRQQDLPLSFGQQRLWFVHQFDPSSSANNVPVTIRLTGKLDLRALEQSIHEIGMRHETLRTRFPTVDGNPIQAIAPDFPNTIPLIDLQALAPAERQDEARRLSAIESRKPFDLERGPIARFILIRFDERDHLLIRNMHCIICDGAACDLFHIELVALYAAFAAGKPSPLPPVPIQYADFALWQRQWLQGEILEQQVNYWRQKLSGSLSTIKLPFDRPRPPGAQAYLGNSRGMLYPKRLNHDLLALSQQCGVTFFMMLLTAFEVFLHRYSGQEDILISFASAARGQVETENLLGFFSNTLFLRTKLERELTFRQLLDRVRQDCLEAFDRQDIPFEKLVEEIKIEQNQDRSPLFQTKFTLNLPWSEGRGVRVVELPDLKIAPQTGYVYPGQTKYDLILVVREVEEGLRTVFDYNADLFDIATIDRMLGHMQNLLEGIVANPDCPIADLPLLATEEQQQFQSGNFTPVEYPAKCIHQLFAERVARMPEAIAIEVADRHITYQELNTRSTKLAAALCHAGVGANVRVGICLDRSLEMFVGLLGILKAGGAYLPLDPTAPSAQLAEILADSQLEILVTQSDLVSLLPKHAARVICVDRDLEDVDDRADRPDIPLGVDRLAAVIYESDAVGKLHGVQIGHEAIANLIDALQVTPGLTDKDTFLATADLSSVMAITELLLPLVVGAKIVSVSREIAADGGQLARSIDTSLATAIQATPESYQRLLAAGWIGSSALKIWCAGGVLSPQLAARLSAGGASVWSLYGATETCGCAIITEVKAAESPQRGQTIGKPLPNIRSYILDARQQLVPSGVSGELYIGGVGLAMGYLHASELTAARFIADPFSQISIDGTAARHSDRLYRTGALARYLPTGEIEYLSGADDRSTDDLPNAAASAPAFIAPRTELEVELCQIWQQVLGIEAIGIQDNFFALGGHSLIAVRLFAEIERVWGRNLPLATLLQAQTIASLADVLSQRSWTEPWSSLVAIQPEGTKPPLFCMHPIGGNILEYYPLVQYLGTERPIYGLQSQGLDGKQAPLASIEAMASQYIDEIATVQPHGPYFLAGYSFGGLLTFEIAQQLQARGERVELLALLDCNCPNLKKVRPSWFKSIQIHLSNLWQLDRQERWKYITDRIDYRFKNVDYREFLIRSLSEVAPPTPELLALIDANFQANRDYIARPYAGDVTLLRCRLQTLSFTLSHDLGWGEVVSGKLKIYDIASSHYGFLREPHIQIVAKILKSCLDAQPSAESQSVRS